MAEFQASADDLRELIERQQSVVLRRQGRYPLAAFLVAAVLSFFYIPAALAAGGMCIAWSISVFLEWRNVTAASLWRHAWIQESCAFEIEDEGIRVGNQRGSSFIRWDSGIVVRAYGTCFVLEEEGEDLVVLPKRHLNSGELLVLAQKASEAA